MRLKNIQAQAVKEFKTKLLVICGPTATGKTRLALYLAKKLHGELVSADSRQVYSRMVIGTGKDIPLNSKFKIQSSKLGGFYEIDNIRLWGCDLVEPSEEFSVAQYIKIADSIIVDIQSRNKLPILVGGTGLYIQGIIEGISTVSIPRSLSIRKKYNKKTIEELQIILKKLSPDKFSSMNESDIRNPRRLIRAIEIAKYNFKYINITEGNRYQTIIIGLKTDKDILKQIIKRRVEDRIKKGMEEEVRSLLASGIRWSNQSMNTFGYKHFQKYISDECNIEDLKKNWVKDEYKYAKRQMTWFKKNKDIIWFDISGLNWQSEVEKTVTWWYSYCNEGEQG